MKMDLPKLLAGKRDDQPPTKSRYNRKYGHGEIFSGIISLKLTKPIF